MWLLWTIGGLIVLCLVLVWVCFKTRAGSRLRVRMYGFLRKAGPWWRYDDADYLRMAMVLEKILNLRPSAVIVDARNNQCILRHLLELRPDVVSAPYPSDVQSSVDAILCSEGINDLTEDEAIALLEESLADLKPGGFMWIPNVIDSTTNIPFYLDWTVSKLNRQRLATLADPSMFKTIIIPHESLFGEKAYTSNAKSYFIHKQVVTGRIEGV